MSMSDHIKQRVLQEFFANKVAFSWKTAKLESFVLPEWEKLAHISKIFYLFGVETSWHTVLICCTICDTEQPKEQLQKGDRGSNESTCNQSVFIFFSLSGSHVFVLFFHLLILFILHGLLRLI